MHAPFRDALIVFGQFLRLGCICFGGPTAHIGVFRQQFVDQLHWLTADEFAHDLTLCQLIPGPASSQLGMLIGARRAGMLGSVAAWLGFTLPSALLLTAAALGNTWLLGQTGLVAGLLLGAAVTVTWAVWQMLLPLRSTPLALGFAGVSALCMLVWPAAQTQLVLLGVGAVLASQRREFAQVLPVTASIRIRPWLGGVLLSLFVALVVVSSLIPSRYGLLFQTGALVFGGGHVVLPMLLERLPAVVPNASAVIAQGYALAQLVPGPLFTLATYIGAITDAHPIRGAAVATVAMFAPGWLLVLGIQPWWQRIAAHPRIGSAIRGTHAVVVGLLAASGLTLLGTHVLPDVRSCVAAVVVLVLLWRTPLPPWTVAVVCGIYGVVML